MYPAMAPLSNTTKFEILRQNLTWVEPGSDRTSGEQAGFQMAALVITIIIAIVGGIITGKCDDININIDISM